MINHSADQATTRMVAIVRDKDGKPKFDDPMNVPQEILDVLTPEDFDHLTQLQREAE